MRHNPDLSILFEDKNVLFYSELKSIQSKFHIYSYTIHSIMTLERKKSQVFKSNIYLNSMCLNLIRDNYINKIELTFKYCKIRYYCTHCKL
jgi:hypothetical protein